MTGISVRVGSKTGTVRFHRRRTASSTYNDGEITKRVTFEFDSNEFRLLRKIKPRISSPDRIPTQPTRGSNRRVDRPPQLRDADIGWDSGPRRSVKIGFRAANPRHWSICLNSRLVVDRAPGVTGALSLTVPAGQTGTRHRRNDGPRSRSAMPTERSVSPRRPVDVGGNITVRRAPGCQCGTNSPRRCKHPLTWRLRTDLNATVVETKSCWASRCGRNSQFHDRGQWSPDSGRPSATALNVNASSGGRDPGRFHPEAIRSGVCRGLRKCNRRNRTESGLDGPTCSSAGERCAVVSPVPSGHPAGPVLPIRATHGGNVSRRFGPSPANPAQPPNQRPKQRNPIHDINARTWDFDFGDPHLKKRHVAAKAPRPMAMLNIGPAYIPGNGARTPSRWRLLQPIGSIC